MALLLIPATMTALAPTLNQVIFWRFVHGLLLPPIFAVTIAYIGDEWPPGEANGVFGIYASASSVGGFLGRFVPGMLTTCRLARRLPGAGLRLGDLLSGGAAAYARAEVRPRQQSRHFAAADAGASAQPAAAGDLRRRLRRAVQFHRHLHLSELPSRRAAVQQIAGVSRLDLRRLSVGSVAALWLGAPSPGSGGATSC